MKDNEDVVKTFIKFMNPEYKKNIEFVIDIASQAPNKITEITKDCNLSEETIKNLKEEFKKIIENKIENKNNEYEP